MFYSNNNKYYLWSTNVPWISYPNTSYPDNSLWGKCV